MHNFDPEKIYQQMIEVANADGIISSDERAIIASIKDNIAKYYQILVDSYQDEIITADEQNNLYQSRRKIMEEALTIAKKDETISQEEFTLLRVIRDLLKDMELNEHY